MWDDDRGMRGLWLALGGVFLIPISLLGVAIVPEQARTTVFLLGLAAVAVVAGRGGWLARAAFVQGGPHRIRAFAGAAIGLAVAATAGLILLWSVVGLGLG